MVVLAKLRWGSVEEQVCPTCGLVEKHYYIRTRKQWRCKAKECRRTFSVTSDTPFADRKISYRHLLIGLFEFLSNQKGLSALKLRRTIGHSYQTCFTFLGKVREALSNTVDTEQMEGLVQIDGGHFSGRPRKGNKKKPPKSVTVPKSQSIAAETEKKASKGKVDPTKGQHRRKFPSRSFAFHHNRRIVVVCREVSPTPGVGGVRSRVAICRTENSTDMTALAKQWIKPGSLIWTDEGVAFSNLKFAGFRHQTVNHAVEFSSDEGVSDNHAESFFSRLRRAVIGIYHRVTPHYMLDYAEETSWREHVRRKNTVEQLLDLGKRVFNARRSVDWLNYSHGHHRTVELLFVASKANPNPQVA